MNKFSCNLLRKRKRYLKIMLICFFRYARPRDEKSSYADDLGELIILNVCVFICSARSFNWESLYSCNAS